MPAPVYSQRVSRMFGEMTGFLTFFQTSAYSSRIGDPDICDFVFGNPHEMPLPGFVAALQQHAAPHNKDWFAYKMNEAQAVRVVAETLRRQHGMPFGEDDIAMTNGAFAAISVVLTALTDPGDEVIYISPPWFFYAPLITALDAKPVRVPCDPVTFDLDLAAIEQAITPRTRAIIVNSPNNPTGRIYPPETLSALGALLTTASARQGRPIYLLSDEAYKRIVFDGVTYPTPTRYYPYSFLIYTYGKTLLTPGQRIGYIALAPEMPARPDMRDALLAAQIAAGWAYPNALLQHGLGDIEKLSIDIEHLQEKRDRMVTALRDMGYALHKPEGTFYLLVRSPLEDDLAFIEILNRHNIFVLPGSACEMPGYFRISLTANDAMIDKALPRFAAAIQEAHTVRA